MSEFKIIKGNPNGGVESVYFVLIMTSRKIQGELFLGIACPFYKRVFNKLIKSENFIYSRGEAPGNINDIIKDFGEDTPYYGINMNVNQLAVLPLGYRLEFKVDNYITLSEKVKDPIDETFKWKDFEIRRSLLGRAIEDCNCEIADFLQQGMYIGKGKKTL